MEESQKGKYKVKFCLPGRVLSTNFEKLRPMFSDKDALVWQIVPKFVADLNRFFEISPKSHGGGDF